MESGLIRKIFADLICVRSDLRGFEIGPVDHGVIGGDPSNSNIASPTTNFSDVHFMIRCER
jgi:hypothetical protein